MKEGQLYSIRNSLVTGIVVKISATHIELRRLTDSFGKEIAGMPLTMGRKNVEKSILTGHIVLYNQKNDPNMMFKLRKRDVHS